jgi:probable HAF family extracellular repeat protein
VTGDSSYTSYFQALHGFIWQEGVMEDLGDLGWDTSQATDISQDGTIVGYAYANLDANIHAFLWQTGVGIVDLGTGGGWEDSALYAITDNFIGSGYLHSGPGPDYHAALWTPRGWVDLHEATPGTPTILEFAYGVNVRGEAIVLGDNQRAYLLTPLRPVGESRRVLQ